MGLDRASSPMHCHVRRPSLMTHLDHTHFALFTSVGQPKANVRDEFWIVAGLLRHDRHAEADGKKAKKSKSNAPSKYTCGGCGLAPWAKPAPVMCGDCEEPMGEEPV